jgi:nucleotide-binding universal stress UspA family protein
VPVLLVRPSSEGSAPAFEPGRILVPLDSTSMAEAALKPAADLARLLSTEVHLVTVVPTLATARGDLEAVAQVMPGATRAALDMQEEDARDYLERVAQRLREEGVTVTTEVRRGETARVLADEAAEPEVGLVVVATHGRAGVRAAWAGSVADRLLGRTRAAILLLRVGEAARD